MPSATRNILIEIQNYCFFYTLITLTNQLSEISICKSTPANFNQSNSVGPLMKWIQNGFAVKHTATMQWYKFKIIPLSRMLLWSIPKTLLLNPSEVVQTLPCLFHFILILITLISRWNMTLLHTVHTFFSSIYPGYPLRFFLIHNIVNSTHGQVLITSVQILSPFLFCFMSLLHVCFLF